MKTFKHILILIITSVFLFVLAGCKKSDEPDVLVISNEIEMVYGEKLEIKYTVVNLEGTDLVDIKVNNPDIISLNGNIAYAIKEGETDVKISLKQDPTKYEIIHITVIPKKGIRIDGPKQIYIGEEIQLNAILNQIDDYVVWSLDSKKIASIDDEGVILGRNQGKVVVSAKCGEYTDSLEIEVLRKPRIMITGRNYVYVGRQEHLEGKLQFTEGEITWASSDIKIATVENGIVTGVKEGEVIITASYKDIVKEHKMQVLPKPEIEIIGKTELKEFETTTLSATLADYSGEFTWESSDSSIVKVDPNGTLHALKPGTVVITCKAIKDETKVTVTVTGYKEKIIYDHNGGTSLDLYNQNTKTGYIEVNNYNNNPKAFWDGGYADYIYISDKAHDPKATFSDRIYIGLNQYTGFYEVKGFLKSGPSSWQKDAEYVITVSSSYKGFNTIHNQIRDIEIGDVCFFDKDINKITNKTPSNFSFYNPNITTDKLLVTKDMYKGTLITPVKLGCKFLGWYNEDGVKIDKIENLDKIYYLKARWEVLNPVLDIIHNDIPTTLYKNDTFKINAKVSPNDAFFKEIIFKSSNNDCMTISDDGLITVLNTGSSVITIRDYASQIVKTFEIEVLTTPSIDIKFNKDFNGILNVNDTITLEPTIVGDIKNTKFTYSSNDKNILTVDEAGVVKAINNGSTEIIIKLVDNTKEYTLNVGFTVNGLTNETKVDKLLNLLLENNFSVVETGNFSLYDDGKERYYRSTYGSVNRFLFDELKPNTKYVNQAINNPRCHKTRGTADTIEFVTVHDTATLTGTVEGIANNMSSAETSIHYTVGNGEVYQVVPEKYIAWHAGDGSSYSFSWRDTKVKANGNSKPNYDLVRDGQRYYLQVNGVKTDIVVPITGTRWDGSLATISNPSKADFCDLEPVYTIINGTYHVGPMWACFSQNANGSICSQGGNNNSIGIEMCVNTTSDIYDTLQRTAMLVSDIMIRNNLGMERVQKHNSWSGKNCPQVERSANFWSDFMKMVELQYEVRKNYSDCTITMKSNNPELVSDTGRVITHPLTTKSVSYEIKVKCGNVEKTITMYSVIPGSTLWQEWNGTYPSSRVWNDGKFQR